MAVTYYLTLKTRSLDIFLNKKLNIEPVIFSSSIPKSLQNEQKVGLNDFNLLKCIGLGGFSRVYLVQKKDTGNLYALKLIDKKFIIDNKKEVIVMNERNIMTILDHPYLLKLEYSFES